MNQPVSLSSPSCPSFGTLEVKSSGAKDCPTSCSGCKLPGLDSISWPPISHPISGLASLCATQMTLITLLSPGQRSPNPSKAFPR